MVRSDPYQIFYINMDLSKGVTGLVLLKADDSLEATKSEAQEKVGEIVNLTSSRKEYAYGQFPSSRDQRCHHWKSQDIVL